MKEITPTPAITTFKSKISKKVYLFYGNIFIILLILTIISVQLDLPLLISLIILFTSFPFLVLMISSHTIVYILTTDAIICKWLFKKITIKYSEILYVRSYVLMKDTFRVYGIPLLAGERNNPDGDFYVLHGGNSTGFLFELDSEKSKIFGAQIFISPCDSDRFVKDYQRISGLTIDYIVI